MRRFLTIMGREWRAYFLSPLGYVILASFLFMNGLIFWAIVAFLSRPGTSKGEFLSLLFSNTTTTGGDTGDSAKVGAVAGGVVQRNRNRQAAAAQNDANAQQQAAGNDAYTKARGACMEGKGYTVK